ncbi:MAG: DUF4375 domain-containing protein [Cyanobacteriota bacterium]
MKNIHEYLEGNYSNQELIFDYYFYKKIQSYGGFANNNDKYIYYLVKLILDVNNGGLIGYFSSTNFEEIVQTIDILNKISARKNAELLSKAVRISNFTKDFDKNLEIGHSFYSSLSEKQEKELGELDRNFLKNEEDFMELFLHYLKHEKELEKLSEQNKSLENDHDLER